MSRLSVAVLGAIVALAFGMHETHILSTGGHSFGSI